MKPRPTGLTTTVSLASLKPGEHHAHGCTVCSQRYTDSCREPDVNARCVPCRAGTARASWDKDYDPVSCCRKSSRLATKEDAAKYRLGGASPWYRCVICSRTHPYDPRPRGRT